MRAKKRYWETALEMWPISESGFYSNFQEAMGTLQRGIGWYYYYYRMWSRQLMEGRKAWEAAGKDTVVKFSRADPNNRLGCKQLVWEVIPGNKEQRAGKWDSRESYNRQFTTRQATLDVSFVARGRQRRLVTRGETLLVWIRCLQGS